MLSLRHMMSMMSWDDDAVAVVAAAAVDNDGGHDGNETRHSSYYTHIPLMTMLLVVSD